MPNRLAGETSPYLQQHADNPVDWYAWGKEALQKAKIEDRPIFLSIGYSACHWCHVMERESFEDEKTADILNHHFVSVKVDREERPDLDRIYMKAVQALTGSGGWPMSVFLTPDGKPFYAGTYFPPEPRYGMPSFKQVLRTVADAWESRRQSMIENSERVVESIERQMTVGEPGEDLRREALALAFRNLQRDFDEAHGGWGGASKFPQPMVVEFLLRYHRITREAEALRMATKTLDAMARGGIYDQLGGGFHRYSVDERWLVPHFEKMLYDNAQLARVYLHAWQVTEEPLFRAVAEETLDYVKREMTDPAGGFYSAQGAESEGEEGKFFLWTPEQIASVLGDQASEVMALYGVTPRGNASTGSAHGLAGKNVLTFSGSWGERQAMAEARRQLFEKREERARPDRDEKVLASWNGLMLGAFAEAGRAFEREDYLEIAERNAAFLLGELRAEDGRLLHVWKARPGRGRGDGEAKIEGYLEDYSHLTDGLLALYQATFEPHWYAAAEGLTDVMLEHFRAPEGGFFDTSDEHEKLVARPRSLQDNAVPSGNAMAAFVLLRLTQLAIKPHYAEEARQSLRQVQPMIARYPLGFGQWLIALDYALASTREIALVGDPQAEDLRAMLGVCVGDYRPHQVLAAGDPGAEAVAVPLLENREQVEGQATAYVCVDFTCQRPITEPDALRQVLEE